jgi:hypothetical protein
VFIATLLLTWLLPLNERYVNQTDRMKNMGEIVMLSFNNPNLEPDDMYGEMENLAAWHRIEHNTAEIDDRPFHVFVYDGYIDRYINYNFASGGRIGNPDQIIITHSASRFLSVGDTVEITYYNASRLPKPVTKEVCGILKDDVVFYSTSHGTVIGAEDLTANLNDPGRFYQDDYSGLGFITFDDVFASILTTNLGVYYLEPKDLGEIESLKYDGALFGTFTYGADIYADAKEKETDNIKGNRTINVSIALLCGTTLFGSSIINMYKRRSEIAVLFLCGATRKIALSYELLRNCVVILIAYACGAGLSAFMLKHITYLPFSLRGGRLSVLFICAVYLATMLAVFMVLKKESVADIIKGD